MNNKEIRENLFGALTELGVGFKKNASTESLTELLEESQKQSKGVEEVIDHKITEDYLLNHNPQLEDNGVEEGDVVGIPAKLENEEELQEEPEKVEDDYLQKYQYRKQTIFGSVGSNPQAGSKAEIMKKNLLSQPKVKILIPKPEGMKGNQTHSVGINGYRLDLPMDEYVDVPQQVADLLQDSLKQTRVAIETGQISSNNSALN